MCHLRTSNVTPFVKFRHCNNYSMWLLYPSVMHTEDIVKPKGMRQACVITSLLYDGCAIMLHGIVGYTRDCGHIPTHKYC